MTIRDPAGGEREPHLHDTVPTVQARLRGAPAEQRTVVGGPDPQPTRAVDLDAASQPHRVDGAEPDDDHAAAMFAQASAGDRYEPGPLLGLGGMGEVVAKGDRATGRTVAVKRVRTELASPTLLRRFAREARIQAQLEHPSIVPVYDVGVDADGARYFTMKRIRGHSLSHVIEHLRWGDPAMAARFTRRRLLTVLSTVALTVEYAHRRGVIHRDLKPSNVMLGDLGEVYVLDWGLADVIGPDGAPTVDLGAPPTAPDLSRDVLDSPALPETGTGVMLGTPGYAAPEMIDPKLGVVDGRADVYALGCMLYELLTFERLHAGQVLGQILGSALDLDGAHPATRVAEIPPELDALCYRATRRDPSMRLATAAELARGIDAYLDGDRDLVERRRLADVHADEAVAALDRGRGGDRAAALRAVTTALGLDPGHARARATLVRLLTEPSPEAIAGAEADEAVTTERKLRRAAVGAMFASATFALYLPIVLWMGIRSWPDLAMISAGVVVTIATTYTFFRRKLTGELPLWHLAVSAVGLATGAVVISPIVLLPALAIGTGVGYIAIFGRRVRLVIATMVAIVMVPLALELAGALPPSIRFVDGTLVLVPRMVAFPRVPTLVFIVVSHTVIIVTGLLYVWRLRKASAAAERRLAIQAWQLRQLVPDEHRELLADRM
ncbi:MAG TPA: serine/threonine-protein kinase [Kofleriaceae bacterium]|nr:serine/threonine-protein kinase [Kofleriaceae bacterium]